MTLKRTLKRTLTKKKERRSARAERRIDWPPRRMPPEGAPAQPAPRSGSGGAFCVALFELVEPGASVDAEDMNAFLYTLALHQAELHSVGGGGSCCSVAFTHRHPAAFVAAVIEDFGGYLRARHGWTGPVLDVASVELSGSGGESAAVN